MSSSTAQESDESQETYSCSSNSSNSRKRNISEVSEILSEVPEPATARLPSKPKPKVENPDNFIKKENFIKEEETKNEIWSEMEFELECPSCSNVPVDLQIFSCTVGHSVCENCYEEGGMCRAGPCDAKYNRTRNFIFETLVKKLKVKCTYERCDEPLTHSGLERHVKICEYRPMPCFETNGKKCNGTLIEQHEFVQHLKTVHNGEGIKFLSFMLTSVPREELLTDSEMRKGVRYSNSNKPIYYIQVENEIFLRNIVVKDESVYFWVTYLGPEEDANKYYVNIFMTSTRPHDIPVMFEKDGRKISWTHSIHSHHKSFSEVQTFGDYACISIKNITPYLNRVQRAFSVNLRYEVKQRVYFSQ